MERKKLEIVYEKKDSVRAGELLLNLLYYFPFDPRKILFIPKQIQHKWFEGSLFPYDQESFLSLNEKNCPRLFRFWEGLIGPSISAEGFTGHFPKRTVIDASGALCHSYASGYAESLIKILLDDTVSENLKNPITISAPFQAMQHFFFVFFQLLSPNNSDDWPDFLEDDQSDLFYMHFGIRLNDKWFYDKVLTRDQFVDQVNRIFTTFYGKTNIVELFPDGHLSYSEATEEARLQSLAFRSLRKRNMGAVLHTLHGIHDKILTGDYNGALGDCRDATESFLKDMLIRHKIKSITVLKKGKKKKRKIVDCTLNNLVQELGKNIDKVFKLPSYYKKDRMIDEGLKPYIQAIGGLIGASTSDFRHGAGSDQMQDLSATKEDCTSTFDYVISLINTLTTYEKK